MSTHDILHRLSDTLASRRNADPEKSYTAKLFSEGPDSILKKIGEECAELIMAGKEGKRLNIVWESTISCAIGYASAGLRRPLAHYQGGLSVAWHRQESR